MSDICTNCVERPRQQGPGTLCTVCIVTTPRAVVPVEEHKIVVSSRDYWRSQAFHQQARSMDLLKDKHELLMRIRELENRA